MKYNQYSYIPTSADQAMTELLSLGFEVAKTQTLKDNLEAVIRRILALQFKQTDDALSTMIADFETNLEQFFQSNRPLTKQQFQTIALQLLGFIPHVDFTDTAQMIEDIAFPITSDDPILPLYQLLATRTKSGNTLIDQLVAQNLIPVTNDYVYFNGKSLATFDTSDTIKEVVYVDTCVDTDSDGRSDLVKVSIIRPKTHRQLPVMMTASPYHQGD